MATAIPAGLPPMDPSTGDSMPTPTTVATKPIVAGANKPIEIRLKSGSELHGKILARLKARLDLSRKYISTRYDDWDRVDENCRMFIDLTRKPRRADKLVVSDDRKKEMPFERAVKIPASYASHKVRLAQLASLFGYRDPLLQFAGRGPEDMKSAELIEATLAYDAIQSRYFGAMHQFIQDADRYGVACIYDVWEQRQGWRVPPVSPLVQGLLGGIPFGDKLMAILQKPVLGTVREYNSWQCTDPYNTWPDPRTSVYDCQKAEFQGHRIFRGHSFLLENKQPNGPYFNIDAVSKALPGASATKAPTSSSARWNVADMAMTGVADEKDKGFFAIDNFQVKLVPADWELGDETDPQIWWFAMVDERVIVRAHASSYLHDEFTYGFGEIEPDSHSMFNPGMMENLDGLQRTIDWLFNSHIDNTRRLINIQALICPNYLEMEDVLNPGPAAHIRLNRLGQEAVRMGMDPSVFMRQMQFSPNTQTHLATVSSLHDFMQRLSAANDTMQGQPLQEQKTLGEVQAIIGASSQRLSITARMLDTMAFTPLAQRAVSNRQQFTSLEQYFKISGDLLKQQGAAQVLVNKDSLQGDFDYIPHSGVMPPDPARQGAIWSQFLQAAGQIPELMQPGPDGKILDIRQVFNEMVRQMGIRNVDQFYTMPPPPPMPPPGVMPDEQIQQQVQAGNMVPMPA